tara:strand:- start:12288 stop:13475 length:1188 start_codon:yes stop_codon:yes gene_type:complete
MPESVEQLDHSARGHAEFSPSQLKYLKQCSAYQGTDGTNPAAERGTRIHEALEAQDPSALHDEEELNIYNEIVDEETNIISAAFSDSEPDIIREIVLDIEHDAHTEQWGTLDFFAITKDRTRGLAIDYKTGWGPVDSPSDNMQARSYTLGLFQKYPELEKVTFVFLLPVRGEVLAGVFAREEMESLREEVSSIIRNAETTRPKWESGQPELEELNPGVDCRFCRYENKCPALGAVAVNVASRYIKEHEDDLGKHADLLPDGPISSKEIDDPEILEKLYVTAIVVMKWAEGIKHKVLNLALEDGDEQFDNLKLRSLGAKKTTLDGNALIELGVKHGLTKEEIIDWEQAVPFSRVVELAKKKAPKGKKAGVARDLENEALEEQIVEKGKTRYTLSVK